MRLFIFVFLPPAMNNNRHYAAAISAFTLWGFFSIPLRALKDYSAGEILYFRILLSAILLFVIVFGFKRAESKRMLSHFNTLTPAAKRRVILLTLAGGALLSVNWLSFIYIVNNINIKTASFSYLICPVFTAVLGFVLIKEKLTPLQWYAVGLCAISCVLIGMQSASELAYSIFTAITYALYLITQRINQGFDRMIMLGIQVVFSLLILTIFFSVLVDHVPTETYFFGLIGIIAIVFTILPLFLNLFALNRINSAAIGILMYINPLINFSVAFSFFHETISSLQIIGYCSIAVALILFNYPHLKKLQVVSKA